MDISLLISTITGAKQLADALIGERDRQKAATIQIDLTEKIAQAQLQLLEVIGTLATQGDELRVVSKRLGELESNERERERYQLAELTPGRGAFAYRLRPAAELIERQDEPAHFVCQPCLDIRRHKVVLHVNPGGAIVCPACKATSGAGIGSMGLSPRGL